MEDVALFSRVLKSGFSALTSRFFSCSQSGRGLGLGQNRNSKDIDLAAGVRYFQIVVPTLPGKAFKRQMPFRADDGIFEEQFIEDRRKALEVFVNKFVFLDLKRGSESCFLPFIFK